MDQLISNEEVEAPKKLTKKNRTVFETLRDFGRETKILEGKGTDNQKLQRLSDLFKPPIEILFPENFEILKAVGAKEQRWLIINIQDMQEFTSHQLNRDVWSNDEIKNLIKGSFLFWQRYQDTIEGKKIISFYHLQQLPCILLLDPRTGELLLHLSGFISPPALLSNLLDFLKSHSFNNNNSIKNKTNPLSKIDNISINSNIIDNTTDTVDTNIIHIDNNSSENLKSKSIIDLSEEEQIAAAIAASLDTTSHSKKRKNENNNNNNNNKDNNINSKSKENEVEMKKQKIENYDTENKNNNNKDDNKEADNNNDESKILDCTIRIRNVNGETITEKYNSEDKLNRVIETIRKKGVTKTILISIPYPRKDFEETDYNKTLKQLNLTPTSVLMISIIE